MRKSIVVGARARRALALGTVIMVAASLLRFSAEPEANAADTLDPAFVDQTVVGGLVLPTSMARLPDGRILVTEKAGRVRVVKNGQLLATPFLDYTAITNEALDRGLISVAVGPDFATTGYVYLTFVYDYNNSDSSSATTSRLVRVTANGDVMLPNSQVVILGPDIGPGCASQTSPTCLDEAYPSHTIDQVTVAADGTLWVSLGDSGDFDNPDQRSLRSQNLDSYRGKLLHIAANGDGLTSNPFYTNSVTTVRSKVYAYGFRNPFRFSLNPVSNTIYLGDVGWGNYEEINVVTPGGNYGWPCYEGAGRQSTWAADPYCQNMYNTNVPVRSPLVTYSHNGVGASVVMGDFTPVSTTFPAAFRNGFFYADYAQDWIRFQPVTASNTTNGPSVEVGTGLGGPVDFEFFPDGNLYYLTILSGEIHRLVPNVSGGSTQYVSDLPVVGTPTNGYGPFERDKSNGEGAAGDGRALKVAGVTYTKGLGVHAVSDISFAVPSGCSAFLASVGIDDEVGTDPGDVVFEVWNGTSSRLYQSPLKSVGQAATAVNVSMSGVSTVRLVVTAGGDNNWFDHADWGNARFSCTGGGGDVTAPVISGVGASVTSSSATISWTTDEGSSSQVEWGTTTAYGSSTVLDSALVTAHGQSIGGLLAGTLYHYRVRSADAAGNVGVSGDNVFTTAGSGGGGTQYVSDLPTVGTPVNGYGPFERDSSNGEGAAGDGRAMRVAGVAYAKGLGVHAASDISFAVPSGCTSFDASVGIDDEVGSDPGDVVFEVWNGTSSRLYQSPLKAVGQAATAVNVSLSGVSTLRLVVTPGADNNWFDHADWGNARFTCSGGTGNAAPVPVISAPSAGYKYKVGDTIAFSGSATDAEDGPLAPSKLSWNVLLKHCPGGVCHVHPYLSYTGTGSSFVVPDHGDDSYFEIALSATDSQGLAGSTTLRLDPVTVAVTLQTSPSGLQLIYSDTTVTTPVVINTVVGSQHVLQALSPQGGATFASWSDGGAQQHTITVGTGPATYTATYNTTGGGATQYVSDLPTVGTPVNGYGPFERDSSNGEGAAGDGRAMRVAGVAYAKGLGVHAASDISFAVPSGCTSFDASVGIDDEVGSDPGDVVFEVWNGTSSRLYQSPLKAVGQAATAVNVSLSGVSTLRLVVTPGADNNWFDHADWGNARFTCGSAPSDTTPPVISAINASPTATAATITWTTNEPSSTRIDYGPTTAYGSSTPLDSGLVTSHSQALSGLTPSTLYHYRVRSVDAAGNGAVSADQTFTTPASTGGGATQYVSDLPTVGTPVNGYGPFERDSSNGEGAAGDGRAMRVAGVAYAKGLGVHAASDISFAVPSGCTSFDASVGIDDEVGSDPGDVVFEVWNGTSSRLYQSPLKAVGQAATAVNVSLSGVSTLRLVVTPGADNNWFDHADWGNARFTCGSAPPDTTPPVISAVGATVTSTGATVTWTTNEPASTQVEYGLTTSYGSTTPVVGTLLTSHSQALSGLTPSTLYHYRVRSADGAGNSTTSGDFTFTTSSGGGGAVFGSATAYTTGSGSHPHASAIADFNADGKNDVAVALAGTDQVSVRLGNGNGTFGAATTFAVGDQPKSVAVGDFNGDGKPDLVTANQGNGTANVSLLLGNGNGTFAAAVNLQAAPNSHEAAVGDLNGDGKADLAVVGWGGSVVSVLLGNGNGTFAAKADLAVGTAPHSVVIVDLNGDGKADLATANHDSGTVSVLLGNGNGTFAAKADYTVGSGPHSIRAGDLSGDGRPDLVVANDSSSSISVLRNNGNGTFAAKVDYATTSTPKGVAIADVNGDGKLDVLVASIAGNYPDPVNAGADRVALFLGTGTGSLTTPRTDYAAGTGSFSVVIGDLNSDGRPDMVVTNWHDGAIQVRLNQS